MFINVIIEWYCRVLINKIVKLLRKRDVLSNHSINNNLGYFFITEINLINKKIIKLQKQIIFWSDVIK